MAPQKRSAEEADSLITGVKALLVDIEGTTTSISFVKDKLFPYVKDNCEKYITAHFDDAETQKDITALRELKDKEEGKEGVVEIPDATDSNKDDVIKAVIDNIKWQMSSDRKSTELKQIQGHIWREGYTTGVIKGELFEDVCDVLRQLQEEEINIYVYSSGSVESQKLFFANTNEGDMSDVFNGYFDTTTGDKKDSASYKKIASEIGVSGDDILFLTDCTEEATAAVAAGLRSTLVIRPGNKDLDEKHLQKFSCIENFSELFGDEDDEEDLKRLATGDNGDLDDDDDDDEVVDEDDDDGEDSEGDEGV
ncbi:hypothetical protein LOTGIDRAFT_132223 [Lottia gigantea]|uniref:Acireductone synthase n=1 Tax=Lottia gigantea TaxID=225164 RepID=V3ZPP4_LOTGI|nr:hypothetical protein LOTGIDRAFT_132223 [Lottia gigantea]ESO84470.1 hypothetical protein LOTGIDRAFT_132223 [Lottia gigantea]